MKYNAPMEWEAQEIDRAFDLCNLMFGAALGAYVGVVMASSNLKIVQIWWLSGALFPLGIALFSFREAAQILRGAHKGPIVLHIIMTVLGTALSLLAFSNSGFRSDVAFAIEVSWFAMLIYLVGLHAFRKVWSK